MTTPLEQIKERLEKMKNPFESRQNSEPYNIAITDVQELLPSIIQEVVEKMDGDIHKMTRKGRYFIKGESSKAGKYKNEGYHVAVKEIRNYLKSLASLKEESK